MATPTERPAATSDKRTQSHTPRPADMRVTRDSDSAGHRGRVYRSRGTFHRPPVRVNTHHRAATRCSNAGREYLPVKFNNPNSSTSASAVLGETESGENFSPHPVGLPSARQQRLTISYPGG
jgi:uncharacterized protein (DUF736 family)